MDIVNLKIIYQEQTSKIILYHLSLPKMLSVCAFCVSAHASKHQPAAIVLFSRKFFWESVWGVPQSGPPAAMEAHWIIQGQLLFLRPHNLIWLLLQGNKKCRNANIQYLELLEESQHIHIIQTKTFYICLPSQVILCTLLCNILASHCLEH